MFYDHIKDDPNKPKPTWLDIVAPLAVFWVPAVSYVLIEYGTYLFSLR